MTCDTIQFQLTAFLDGEMSAETAAGVEAHLQTCEACAEAREALAALGETISAWAVNAPDITSSVMQAVIADDQSLLLAEMRELRTEIRRLREEVAARHRARESRLTPPQWLPAQTPAYTRMEENDPWNFVRS